MITERIAIDPDEIYQQTGMFSPVLERLAEGLVHGGGYRYPWEAAIIGQSPLALYARTNEAPDWLKKWGSKQNLGDLDLLLGSIKRPVTVATGWDELYMQEQIGGLLRLPYSEWEEITPCQGRANRELVTFKFKLNGAWSRLPSQTVSLSYASQTAHNLDDPTDWLNQIPFTFIPIVCVEHPSAKINPNPKAEFSYAFSPGGWKDLQSGCARIANPDVFFNETNIPATEVVARLAIAFKYLSYLPDPNNIEKSSRAKLLDITSVIASDIASTRFFQAYCTKISAGLPDTESREKFEGVVNQNLK